MKSFLFVSILLLFQINCFSQNENSSEVFLNLLKIEFEAFQKKDPALWINQVNDSAVFTEADNSFKTKGQIVEEMKNAPDIFINATETYESVLTRIYDNTAVLSCMTTFSFITSNGKRNSMKFKFTRVHIKEGNNWKLVYHSAIPVEF